jgi:hypothetical protein
MTVQAGLSPRLVFVIPFLLFVGSTGLVGYGQWAEDVCITDGRASLAPEGSSGSTHVLAWPPGAVRCEWKSPQGTDMSFTVAPFFDQH